MIKKEFSSFIILLLILSLVIVNITPSSVAATNEDAFPEGIEKPFGLNPDEIPASEEEIRDKYLKQEWAEIISKNKYIGPIHNFFIAHPLIFKLLFKEPYSFTPTFFIIFILWLYAFAFISDILSTSGFVKKNASFFIGLGSAIILAQINLLNILAKSIYSIIFSNESWWIRLIIWVFLFSAMMILYYIEHLVSKSLKANKDAKEKSDIEQKGKEWDEFKKGLKNQ